MDQSLFSFQAKSTSPDLKLQVRFNDQLMLDQALENTVQDFSFEFDDTDGAVNIVELEMLGKTTDHTVIDRLGDIVSDQVIEISSVVIDGIEISVLFFDQSTYHHDFNGTQETTTAKFYGVMGCNGTVRFEFKSPLYIWFLENA